MSMMATTMRLVAVSAGAAVLMAAAPVRAADVNDPYYDNDRQSKYDDPYDDPRYADMYGDPKSDRDDYVYNDKHRYDDKVPYRDHDIDRYDEHKRYDRNDYEDHEDKYAGKSLKDDYDDYANPPRGSLKEGEYLREFDHQPKFSEPRYRGYACLNRRQIRRTLRADGWGPIRRIRIRGNGRALVFARRRASGRPYALKVDTCTGEIIRARPLYARRFGPWASRAHRRDWRWF